MQSELDRLTISKEYSNLAEDAIQRQDFNLAFVYARQAAILAEKQNIHATEHAITALKQIGDSHTLIVYCDNMIKNFLHNDVEKKGLIQQTKGEAQMKIEDYAGATQSFKQAYQCLQFKKSDIADGIRNIIDNEIPKLKGLSQKTEDAKRDECALVRKHLDNPQLPDSVQQAVYILPGEWLSRWKSYNEYNRLMGEAEVSKDFMTDEASEKPQHPGAINPLCMSNDSFTLIDPEPSQFYTNIHMRTDLTENQDFYIVSEELWTFLYKIYGGIPLQRFTYRKSESDINVSVEVWLQQINCTLIPLPQKRQPSQLKTPDIVYISKEALVSDLQIKLSSIYKNVFRDVDLVKIACRIWKVDPRFDWQQAFTEWTGTTTLKIRAENLDATKKVGESKLSDNDVSVLEYRLQPQAWILSNEGMEESTPALQSQLTNGSQGEGPKMYYSIDDVKKFPSGSRRGLTGLQNLGNTCFMNSAIQCLSHAFELTKYMITDNFEPDLNVRNPLGTGKKRGE